ncbi:GNAT family N-acetyltransferase [Aquimarina muelleri]|uniref:Alanine acetyltransferase n=1 Tax=Aquimarina muelleri TaxID=279356 RepID=A0A918N508_9FLAO|nr:GNAT family N-acetyltransferase [Aquimarina muelleri]MCX2764888.1 GNAT family N-acetyltransferase [Aquimarina muelleri]GGX34453.1 alanine acetyltransferase [Aquimarina muelleri]
MKETYKSFETERLFIRPTNILDADFILELMNSPKWLENIGDRNIKSVKDAEDYIENKILPQLKRLGYSNYTIIRKSDQAKIGCCGLYNREGLDRIDIGFAFLPEYEKKGYGYESVSKLKEIALNYFKLPEIVGITIQTNIGSQKLLEKIGLTFKDIIKLPNDEEEVMLYR